MCNVVKNHIKALKKIVIKIQEDSGAELAIFVGGCATLLEQRGGGDPGAGI